MPDRIIDCCSLVNLYTGWAGLNELGVLDHGWYIADSALKEAQYTREADESGRIISRPMDVDRFVQSGLLRRVKAETAEELELYVNLSTELDDGEAEAMAIAKVRGFTLLTDDAKAIRVAMRPEIAVQTVSTVDILKEWISLDPTRTEELQNSIRRIDLLARFRPKPGTAESDWWIEMRDAAGGEA